MLQLEEALDPCLPSLAAGAYLPGLSVYPRVEKLHAAM